MQSFVSVLTLVCLSISLFGCAARSEVKNLSKAQAQAQLELHHRYECVSSGSKGEFKSALTIVQRNWNYSLVWDNGYVGMGIRVENKLAVTFLERSPDGGFIFPPGVSLYSIEDEKLVGYWASGDGDVYKDTCTHADSVPAPQSPQQKPEPANPGTRI